MGSRMPQRCIHSAWIPRQRILIPSHGSSFPHTRYHCPCRDVPYHSDNFGTKPKTHGWLTSGVSAPRLRLRFSEPATSSVKWMVTKPAVTFAFWHQFTNPRERIFLLRGSPSLLSSGAELGRARRIGIADPIKVSRSGGASEPCCRNDCRPRKVGRSTGPLRGESSRPA